MSVETLKISSKIGDYSVTWSHITDEGYRNLFQQCQTAIVDQNVWDLYGHENDSYGFLKNIILQFVEEEIKTPETSISLCKQLLDAGFKRGEFLLVIGGGVIQDLSTFSASILFRGIPWIFIPTTLLAQADSCIGGKSSLNLERWKNQIGNFYPPRHICIVPEYLDTLKEVDIRSGLGEIIKVHLISGPEMVDRIEDEIGQMSHNPNILAEAVERSLRIKAQIIEEDEFDQGQRLLLNYGHTFGHALESATNYHPAHGVAVTFGADMANYLSWQLDKITKRDYERMHRILVHNLRADDWIDIDIGEYLSALRHDKKNKTGYYCFILPSEIGKVEIEFLSIGEEIESKIAQYLQEVRNWLH